MRLSFTLSRYLSRQFVGAFGGIFLAFASVSFLLDFVELVRRSQSKEDATFSILLEMALYKLPTLAQQILPFAVLFGAMLAFWRLTRHHELVVVRAAGVSVWQFILPGFALALFIGTLKITTVNPVASAMLFHYEELENKYLKGNASILAVSETGLWLRQMDAEGESIVHALKVNPRSFELSDVIIFQFKSGDRFAGRIDAANAALRNEYWDIHDAWITGPDQPPRFEKSYRLRTDLTLEQIQDSFASPESISFWDLPHFIGLLQKAGFSALRQRLYFDQLLADPLLLSAMVLIAAAFSLRHHRRGGALVIILAGVITGFLVYFISDVVLALGLTSTIPVSLAAWTPAGASLLLGLAMLFHIEDG